MNALNILEKKIGYLAIPNLTYYLIVGQVVAFIIITLYPQSTELFILQGNLVRKGEWWRIITYLFSPLSFSPLFAAFIWYLNYIFGTALEHIWGSFRFTLYFIIGYILTITCVFIFPQQSFSNNTIFTSLFLAFAYLNPDFVLQLFFIIPVKIKWLAYIAWFGIIAMIFTGPVPSKILSLISVGNFLLFFSGDIFQTLINRKSPIKKVLEKTIQQEHFMQCATCRKTEHDRKIFSYCHLCKPQTQYCEDHIKTHEHKIKN